VFSPVRNIAFLRNLPIKKGEGRGCGHESGSEGRGCGHEIGSEGVQKINRDCFLPAAEGWAVELPSNLHGGWWEI